MNESGQAVLGIAHEVWGLEALERNINDLWVVHDDMDLDFGRIKIHTGGSSGHHGIDSIIKAVGSSDFIKFRIGIGRMVAENSHQYGNQEFLLSPFTKEEETTIKGVVKKTAEAILLGLDEGIAKAMNKFNK
jgi:PTH1 family peptidyl-tRNA hydrolase